MLKYLLISRAGSGKKMFCKELAKNFKIATSYTTREQRDENDNMHIFVSKDDVAEKHPDRILEKTYNGNTYFYEKQDIENTDIIPIAPEDLETICKMFPDTAFRFLCLMASNEDRIKYATAEKTDKISAEEDFLAICEEENDAFIKFEDSLKSKESIFPQNCTVGHIVINEFTENSDIFKWNNDLLSEMRAFKRVRKICEELAAAGCLESKVEGTYYMAIRDENDETKWENKPVDIVVEDIVTSASGMAHIVGEWLRLSDNSFRDE